MSVEISITEKLKKLWELQQVDSQLDEIQIIKGELPIEVADLEDEVAGLETRIGKLQSNAKELEMDIAKQQNAGKEAEANIKKYQKQLDEVKNNREYEALTKEIELAKLDIQLAEKRANDLRGQLESRKEALTIAEAKFAAKQTELGNKKVELQGIIEKTEQEENKLREASNKARTGIEDRLLNAYDKIRRTYRNGLAVVSVERDACGGCFNRVPPQKQLEVGLHMRIIACEHCGRILVDHTIAHNEAGVEA
ncbi:MAG: C4-type zinc ribbon domain-containing protein [Saprospiraceae bacterium]|nr:C4-type zinc ribbon domain-containing protein [Saprospiraceae bacterium]